MTTYIKAMLRGQCFALPTAEFAAVIDGGTPAPVPFSPPGALGIVRYEDAMIAVFDTFGEQAAPARLLLVIRQKQRVIACTADAVQDFISLNEDEQTSLAPANPVIGSELVIL